MIDLNKKNIMILTLGFGIMLFFIGLATNIALGPSTSSYRLPDQVSSIIKLTGMAFICISMLVGGFFIDDLEKDNKAILLIFGLIFLLLNIFVFTYT